jgi:hypothetical protein
MTDPTFFLIVIGGGLSLAFVIAFPFWLATGWGCGRWQSWVVYTRDGQRVGERQLDNHPTRRAAVRWASMICNSPEALSCSLRTALRGGPMIFANAAVKDREDGELTLVHAEAAS